MAIFDSLQNTLRLSFYSCQLVSMDNDINITKRKVGVSVSKSLVNL